MSDVLRDWQRPPAERSAELWVAWAMEADYDDPTHDKVFIVDLEDSLAIAAASALELCQKNRWRTFVAWHSGDNEPVVTMTFKPRSTEPYVVGDFNLRDLPRLTALTLEANVRQFLASSPNRPPLVAIPCSTGGIFRD